MFCNGFSGLPLVYSGRLNPTERGMFCPTFRQVIGAILKNFLKKCMGVIFELRFSDFKKSTLYCWGKIWDFPTIRCVCARFAGRIFPSGGNVSYMNMRWRGISVFCLLTELVLCGKMLSGG